MNYIFFGYLPAFITLSIYQWYTNVVDKGPLKNHSGCGACLWMFWYCLYECQCWCIHFAVVWGYPGNVWHVCSMRLPREQKAFLSTALASQPASLVYKSLFDSVLSWTCSTVWCQSFCLYSVLGQTLFSQKCCRSLMLNVMIFLVGMWLWRLV